VSTKTARRKSGSKGLNKGPKKPAKASASGRASSRVHGSAAKGKASRERSHAKSKTARSVMAKTTAQKTAKSAAKQTAAKTGTKAGIKAGKTAAKSHAPAKAVAHKVVAHKAVPAKPSAKPVATAAKAEEARKPTTHRLGFKVSEFVVYPAHGVGQILSIEEQEIAGARLELFVINFIKDKMTLRVPTSKIANVGMRKLSEPALVKRALETLKGRARIKRTMWSRRAQEYEAKINSGDIVAIAEVVRDLYRSESQPEQSYSERQLYEAALDRLSREIAAVQHMTETEAVKEIEANLAKSPRRGVKTEADSEVEADGEAEETDDLDGGNTVAEDEAA
jgi:CarD family transcriptional regulator